MPLHIETGRFKNTPLEDRICTLCNSNEIEDEFHFVMKCPVYSEIRNSLFTDVKILHPNFINLSDDDKFVFLNITCQKNLAQYLCNAFDRRRAILYI